MNISNSLKDFMILLFILNQPCHMIVYAKIHKIHRENGWAYLGCKKCGSAAKEIVGTASSSGSKFNKQKTWKCKQHQEITSVGYRYAIKS